MPCSRAPVPKGGGCWGEVCRVGSGGGGGSGGLQLRFSYVRLRVIRAELGGGG